MYTVTVCHSCNTSIKSNKNIGLNDGRGRHDTFPTLCSKATYVHVGFMVNNISKLYEDSRGDFSELLVGYERDS